MLIQFHDMGLHYYLTGALCFGSSLVYAQAQEKFTHLPGDRIRVIVDNSQGASLQGSGSLHLGQERHLVSQRRRSNLCPVGP